VAQFGVVVRVKGGLGDASAGRFCSTSVQHFRLLFVDYSPKRLKLPVSLKPTQRRRLLLSFYEGILVTISGTDHETSQHHVSKGK
jgi:hypothetical protein